MVKARIGIFHRMNNTTFYKPIADYGAIGDLHTIALVGIDASIDWLCFPELDSPSVFGRLLDHRRGGWFRVAPVGMGAGIQLHRGTNVLETVFDTGSGQLTITDFMPIRGSLNGHEPPNPSAEVLRILSCEGGSIEVELEWAPGSTMGAQPRRFMRPRADMLPARRRLCTPGTGRDLECMQHRRR